MGYVHHWAGGNGLHPRGRYSEPEKDRLVHGYQMHKDNRHSTCIWRWSNLAKGGNNRLGNAYNQRRRGSGRGLGENTRESDQWWSSPSSVHSSLPEASLHAN